MHVCFLHADRCAFRLDTPPCVSHIDDMSETIDVRAIRERLGLTQEQLAAKLGLDRTTVSRMENEREPTGPVRILLEQLLRENPVHPDSASSSSPVDDAP